MALVELRFLVDESDVGSMYRHAAELHEKRATAWADDEETNDPSWVEKVTEGGESQVWRPMLRFLAAQPDKDVAWPDICDAVSRTPKEMSGALGAAERRVHNAQLPLPYSKRWVEGVRYFRMSSDVAEKVRELLP